LEQVINFPRTEEPKEEQSKLGQWRAPFRQFALYSHVGMMFPIAIAIGFFAGYILDGWLGTLPLFALLGLVMGFAAATRNLLKTISIEDDRNRRS
jgi:F0F1-type ATP synthase assembly protein I